MLKPYLLIPFYPLYWIYKSAQRMDKLAQLKGIRSGISGVCLFFAIFLNFLPPIIMQARMNTIIKTKTPAVPVASANPTLFADSADQIKKYKELLDMGAITQEEFDQKKTQLLGL